MKVFCFGLGYSALRLHQLHHMSFESFAGTTRNAEKAIALQAREIDVHRIEGNAVTPSLEASLCNADRLIVSAAPDEQGDPILRQFSDVLQRAKKLRQIIYWSTIGVYGDHAGAWVDETTPLNAISERGKRRILAEQDWSNLGKELGLPVQIHRLAGIYGPGRSFLDDYRSGKARRIIKPGQVFNRIHVDDIAGAAFAGFQNTSANGAFNICDDLPCPPQDVVEYAGSLLGMPIPPETPFKEAQLSQMGRSFYAESKRCSNLRLKEILKYQLLHPNFRDGLNAILLGPVVRHLSEEKIG